MSSAAATALALGLQGCEACGLVSRPAPGTDEGSCPRCGNELSFRKSASIQRTWAFLVAAVICYVPANLLPVLTTVTASGRDSDTIMEGVVLLWSPTGWPLSLIVLVASIMIPSAKIVALIYLLITVQRGSVESIRAVLWYADIRGSTAIADRWPGLAVIELLDEVFEALAAPLRQRGGQVLKFLGDGLLATFSVDDASRPAICRGALDAAVEAMAALDRLNAARSAAGKPTATVDLALHLGEVLYGNVGSVDRLDFTVIGPAVNEVSRIETLCEPLGRKVLVSAELAAASGDLGRLEPLGPQTLRGVREPRDIYALHLGP